MFHILAVPFVRIPLAHGQTRSLRRWYGLAHLPCLAILFADAVESACSVNKPKMQENGKYISL